ncbi:MAG TPA: hypothetical protein VM657_10505 [Sphingomonas sp.]|nr:hypothetical protein [Sphingomonas sp.]
MSDVAMRAIRAPVSVSPSPAKVPRERIVTLRAETDHCPQVLLRILGMVGQHDTIPLSIGAERDEDGQHVTIEIDTLPDHIVALLLAKIEAIVTVRRAEIVPLPACGAAA